MLDHTNALVNLVLRSILLSEDKYSDDTVEASYPPLGFRKDPSETVDTRVQYLRFFLNQEAEMAEASQLLQDGESRQLFLSLILFRALGYRRVRLTMNHDAFDLRLQESAALPETPSPLASSEKFPLTHFDLTIDGKTLRLDCLHANIFYTFLLKQYYFSRNGVRIQPEAGDIVIDAGGCFGDTAIAFASETGPAGHVHSFEILSSHLEIMRFNLQQNPELANITLHECALSDRDEQGGIAEGTPNPGFSIPAAPEGIRMASIDGLVASGAIERVDFIKMDMEGYEMPALIGAVQALQRFRPKLAISVYHKWDDYFVIPRFIHGLGCGYNLYLENYTKIDGETVLYAICPDRGEYTRPGPAPESPLDSAVTPPELGIPAAPPVDDAPEPLA